MGIREQAEQLFVRIEHYIIKQSNPLLIKAILRQLNLDKLQTTNQEYNDFLLKVSTEGVDLSKLLEHLKRNILNNVPLCTLLAFIQEYDLVSDAELHTASQSIQLQINILCILEAMVITMANGKGFAQDVYNHLEQRKSSRFLGSPLADFFFGAPVNASLFERLKLISVKPGMLGVLFHKSQGEQAETTIAARQFIASKHLSSLYAEQIKPIELNSIDRDTIPGMGINILEAMWEDSTGRAKHLSGIDNAKAGVGLIRIMELLQYPTELRLVSQILPMGVHSNNDNTYELLPCLKIDSTKKKVSQFHIDCQWRDLYSSWNLLFVIANIDSVFLLLKLLLPTVFSAEAQNYKEVRVLSLFLLASLFLSEKLKDNRFFLSTFVFKNKEILLRKWGEINKHYATELLDELCSASAAEGVEPTYERVLGKHPHLNFMQQLHSFANNRRSHSVTPVYSAANKSAFFKPMVLDEQMTSLTTPLLG